MNDAQLIESIVAIAREAGREILEVYGREFSVQEKQDNSPSPRPISAPTC